ncbi:MAG TPA: Sec-independent protein translocase protein TatB [Aestuariivirgaceae bacterium]|nr:Sec-independent protein translocase protein TatB [Aestuariivirgaceae bacterium]
MFDFGLGSSELLLIAIVALIVIGPKDLPRLLRTMGQYMRKIQGMAREFQNHLNEAAKEVGVDDVKKDIKGMTNFTVTADLDKQGAEIKKAIESSASRASPEAASNGAKTVGTRTDGTATNGADKAKEPAKIEATKPPAASSKPVPAARSETAKSPKPEPKAKAAARPKAAPKPKPEAGPKPAAKAKSRPAPKADRPRETAKS